MKQILFVLGFFLLSCLSVAAQGWQRAFSTSPDSASGLWKTIPTRSGGFISVGYINSLKNPRLSRYELKHNVIDVPIYELLITRTNANGDRLGVTKFSSIQPLVDFYYNNNIDIIAADSGRAYIIVGACVNPNNPKSISGFTLKIDENGQQLWLKRYSLIDIGLVFSYISPLSSGQFMVIGTTNTYQTQTYFLKINTLGDSLWSRTSESLINLAAVCGVDESGFELLIDSSFQRSSLTWAKTDIEGNIQKTEKTGLVSIPIWSIKKDDDDTYLQFPTSSSFARITSRNGTFKRAIDFNIPVINNLGYRSRQLVTKTKDNKWLRVYQRMFINDSIWRIHLTKFDTAGQIFWQKIITSKEADFAGMSLMDINLTGTGGFLISGSNSKNQATLLYLDSLGNYYTNNITGKIYNDINTNCQYNNEQKLKNWLVKAENTRNGDVYWGISDSLGIYNINVDTGSYTVKVVPPNANWQTCTPSVSRSFSQFHTADTLDFGIQPLINCPVLTADMSTPLLRRCMDNIYSVRYGNDGTVAAQNAYITVALDPLLRFQSASLPLSSRVGNLLRFNLGTLDINQSGRFSITTNVACGDSTRLGQTLCNTVHIYPDSVCLLPTDWSGASITVEGTCGHDSVRFTVRNRGVAPSQSLSSVVVEDQVLFATRRVQLSPNGAQVYAFPTNGSTWRMTVEQEPNHPTSRAPTAVVEGCRQRANGSFSTGFVTLFDNDDGNPAEDIDCQQIIGSYDPNDKTGYPIGYDKDNHFINPNQDIEYFIRFQNTGTDTAFTVVVRDTLPPELDIASLELGASSHPYSANMLGKNVLAFNFEKINLVDSFHNEVASHGFVKFRIKQKKDLPLGTRIENGAAIFFDFNAPVLTEKAWHTIGKSWLASVAIDKTGATDVKIKVFPNPLSDIATFDLENTPLSTEGQFLLYDATGRLVRSQKFKGRRFDFDRRDLPSGLFIFRIDSNGQLLGSGKLLVD